MVQHFGNSPEHDYNDYVALNREKHERSFRIVGYDVAVQTSWGVVWTGGTGYIFPTAVGTLIATSSQGAADGSTGTGARSIVVNGLGSGFGSIQEVMVFDIDGQATGTAEFCRINSIVVPSAGTYAQGGATSGDNIGILTISHAENGSLGLVAAGDGVSNQAIYTTPNNERVLIKSLIYSIDANKAADLRLVIRPNADDFDPPNSAAIHVGQLFGITGANSLPFPASPNIAPKTDIWIETQVAGQTGTMTAAFHVVGYQEPNV